MDLELVIGNYFTTNTFTDSEGWTSNQPIKVYDCGDKRYLGGYNAFAQAYIQKKYTNLIEHHTIKFTAVFAKIDTWDSEKIQLFADGTKVLEQAFTPDGTGYICGWSQRKDLITNLEIQFPHTASSLTLKLQDTLDSNPDDESWGIREIKVILIFKCPDECNTCSWGTI